MDVVIDNISSLFMFTVIFLITYTALLNVYFITKNGFRISVNCWFCNKNSKVLYADRNSFICSFCYQYNGFNKNGDYNRIIEAQSNISLNTSNTNFYKISEISTTNLLSNGLCDSCNKNQQLKVLQLAKYEPLNEKNYNVEIEHFEKQIEKTYKLCKKCENIVNNTIRKQNAWIFGDKLKNLRTLKKKGLLFLNLKKHSQGTSEDIHFFPNFSVISLFLLIISLFNLLSLCGIELLVFKDILPESILPSNVIFSDIYSTGYNFIQHNFARSDYLKYLPKTIKTKESSSLCISVLAFCLEIIWSIIDRKWTLFRKGNRLLSWLILGIISSLHFSTLVSSYINNLQLFCTLYLIYSYGSMCLNLKEKSKKKIKLKRFKRCSSELEDFDNENISTESLNETKNSYRTAINKHSPSTASFQKGGLNQSFKSVKSPATFNNTIKNTTLYNTGNVELNKHFHSLNLGSFGPPRPMSCQTFQGTSTNPFLNISRPQSPNSLFNFRVIENNINNPVSRSHVSPTNSFYKLQNTCLNVPCNLSFSEPPRSAFNSENLSFNGTLQNSESHKIPHKISDDVWPRDTSSVLSYNISQSSPISACELEFSQKNLGTSVNNLFRPLSPVDSIKKSNRTLLSPPKLNHIKHFPSDRESENLNISSQFANSSLWSKMNGSNVSQRFVVNSMTNIQSPYDLSESLKVPCKHFPISRSSSSSSGFASNGDFAKAQSNSLPNSRDHSPDRNSILSEPVFSNRFD